MESHQILKRIVTSNTFLVLSDKVVPLLTWVMITFPVWMSPFHPALVAYFIIAFDLYFFYSCLRTVYYSTASFRKIEVFGSLSFNDKIQKKDEVKQLRHFVIIPNYKESIHKLDTTIQTICETLYPYKKISLILAFEKREQGVREKFTYFYNKYKDQFEYVLASYHDLLPNEVAGKASNQTAAAKMLDDLATSNNWNPQDVVVTICDADSRLPKNFFTYLTYSYITDSMRKYHFYWAPVLLYSNFWQLPFFVRIQATLSSILRLAFLSQEDKLIQISTYATSLWLLKEVHFWDVDIIPEDWHIYYQAFFTFGGKVKTIPLFTLVSGDAVYAGNTIKTFVSRYEQEKRWAWGVTDIGYTLRRSFETPHIHWRAKVKKLMYLVENHLFWPTSFFILTVSASIPPLINPVFKRTVLGFILPQLSGFILTLSTSMILVYIYLDIRMRKKVNVHTSIASIPMIFVQWYFLPIISFLLSSLPALESHTRMIVGKKIEYKVTEKV